MHVQMAVSVHGSSGRGGFRCAAAWTKWVRSTR